MRTTDLLKRVDEELIHSNFESSELLDDRLFGSCCHMSDDDHDSSIDNASGV